MPVLVEEKFNTTVGKAYVLYAKNVATDDIFLSYSSQEFVLSYAWTHPKEFCRLYIESFMEKGQIEYFSAEELLFLKPLASAFLALPLDDPPKLLEFNKNRYNLKDLKRFQISKKLLSSSSHATKRKAALTISVLSRKYKTTQSVLEHLCSLELGKDVHEKKPISMQIDRAVQQPIPDEDDRYSPTYPTEDGEENKLLDPSSEGKNFT